MRFRTHYDAVVVGGGHNGLVAAAYLARAGRSVLVLERSDSLGGAATSQRIFPEFDARLSRYAYLVSLLPRQIVRDLDLRITCRRRAIASCTPYSRAGGPAALLLSNEDESVSRASFIRLAGESDWRGYHELLEMERAFAARVWPGLLEPLRSRDEWAASLRTATERRAWDAFVERPLGETLERLVANDTVRGLLLTDAKIGVFTHSHDPTLLQNRCFILHTIGGGTGEWQVPVGGMGALVSALEGSARGAGAQLVTAATVDAIHLGSTRHSVTFRHGDGEQTVEAEYVLVNAGPQVLARLLGKEYVPRPEDEGSVCKVNMLLRRLPALNAPGVDPRHAFGGTFHVDESYDAMAAGYREASAGSVPERPPFEIYCHTLTDGSILSPELRRAGYHTLTLFGLDAPYRLFATGNAGAKELLLGLYLAALNRVLAEPIEDCLAVDSAGNTCVEIKSPVDLERELALNQGNIFHANPSWFFADGNHPAGHWGVETGHERILICGSSAARGGGVSGIPGHNAAKAILAEHPRRARSRAAAK